MWQNLKPLFKILDPPLLSYSDFDLDRLYLASYPDSVLEKWSCVN